MCPLFVFLLVSCDFFPSVGLKRRNLWGLKVVWVFYKGFFPGFCIYLIFLTLRS